MGAHWSASFTHPPAKAPRVDGPTPLAIEGLRLVGKNAGKRCLYRNLVVMEEGKDGRAGVKRAVLKLALQNWAETSMEARDSAAKTSCRASPRGVVSQACSPPRAVCLDLRW